MIFIIEWKGEESGNLKNNETAGVWELGAPSYGILLIDNFVRKPGQGQGCNFTALFEKFLFLLDFIFSITYTG